MNAHKISLGWLLLVAAGAVHSQSLSPGLLAEYNDGKTRVRMVVAAPEFYLEPRESPHPALATAFEAQWTGLVSIITAGEYTFDAGPATLAIDGADVAGKPVSLAAGSHAFAMRYRRDAGASAVRLQWKSAQFPMEPAPASVFFHTAGQQPSREEEAVERGRYLVEEYGCVNCHRSNSTSLVGRMGPDLTDAGSRFTPEWVYKWLESPVAFRGAAVMPGVADAQHRRDLAAYLVSLRAPSAAAQARRSRGNEVAPGASLFGSIGCAACHNQPGLSLEGMGSKTTAAPLAEYLKDPARSDRGGRMPSLMLTNEEASQLAAYLIESRNTAFEQRWTGGDAARGRALMESEGCLACHHLEGAQSRQSVPPLAHLSAGQGCLATKPAAKVPQYRFTAEQRAALGAFLTFYRSHPDVSPAPVYELRARVRQFRCFVCHELDGAPPAAALAEATPPLTAAGAKLRTGWIDRVLTGRARVRKWEEIRMPDYDPRHARPLAAAFAKYAGARPGDGEPAPSSTSDQQTQGAGFIGTDARQKGMGCIGCHDWGAHKSLGEEAPQLINIAERLRYDWYHRWMLNPARILSGTSMPNYFSSMARPAAEGIVHALWAAMSLGDRMPLPAGFERLESGADPEAHPAPGRRPVVVRWDMPEATPAAIAVGLPGKLSYCFDAGESRLRYAWRGGFIDLSETLTRKTDANHITPTAKLVGAVFYRSDGFPFRVGSVDRVPQAKFRGYRLVAGGAPEFRYEVDQTEVTELITPATDGSGISREFTVAAVDRPMWFIDGQKKIEIARGSQVRFSVAETAR